MRNSILILTLALASTSHGQIATDLPFPSEPSAASSPNHKAWAAFGHYWQPDALKNRATVRAQELELAALRAENAALKSQPTSPLPTFDLGPVTTELAALRTVMTSLTSLAAYNATVLQPPRNLHLESSEGPEVKVFWDYYAPEDFISRFYLERSTDGISWIPVGATPSGYGRELVDNQPKVPGTRYYYRLFSTAEYHAKDSVPSNVISYDWK